MIRNIFFDFDGTLADTTEGIVQCTLVTLQKLGLPASTPERIRSVIGLPLTGCFERGTDTPPERIAEACATYRKLFNEIAIPCTTLYPGTKETLADLQARGLTLALCTSRSNNSLNALLQVLGIRAHFSAIVTNEDVSHPKPAPDIALLALERLGVRPDETLVVGDTVFDLQMGRAAGCRTCGVTWGNQGRAQLETAQPELVIDDFSELLAFCNKQDY
ncbi:MAG: HAD family hydrolase [Bacteroidales bacterium]|nr:HAD family hydrolase [Bacteroidales bacterium]